MDVPKILEQELVTLEHLREEARAQIARIRGTIEWSTERIAEYDKEIEAIRAVIALISETER